MKSLWWLFSICLLFGCSTKQARELETNTPLPNSIGMVYHGETPAPTATIQKNPTPPKTPTTIIHFPIRPNTPSPSNTPNPYLIPEDARYDESSPNKEWIVWTQNFDTQIFVQRVDSNKLWIYPKEVGSSDVIHPYVTLEHWSDDGKYLYFILYPPVSGVWYHGGSLYRMELETGKIFQIGNSHWIEPSITPDSKYVAYIHERTTPLKVTFQDLEFLQENSIEIPELSGYDGGSIIWSPDNSKILFTSIKNNDFALVLVNRLKKSYSIITDEYTYVFGKEWISNDEVIFQSNSLNFLLNTETGEFVEIDPEFGNDQ